MDQQTTWILVGDASRARLFVHQDAAKHLSLVREFNHPQSRVLNQDLVSDRPGRVQQSVGASRGGPSAGPNKGSRSAMEPPTEPKTVELARFAHELAATLYKGLGENAYHRLVLIAGPQLLGTLRQVLHEQVTKRIKTSFDKDYTSYTQNELEQRLAPLLADLAGTTEREERRAESTRPSA